jgi:hypothetical protein
VTNRCITGLAFLVLQASTVLAQSAKPTTGVLTRMTIVESRYGKGTIFSIDVDNREYWITAKHILTGAEHPPYGSVTANTESLKILDPGSPGEKWVPTTFTVIDTERDVDIVVLAGPVPILDNPLPSVPADSTGAFLGGDCEFLGFPYGGGWRANFGNGISFWMPFIKHCTVSAMTTSGSVMTQGEKMIWVLDGINNGGFSGGPVIFRTGPDQRIMAVVSGYIIEPTAVTSSGLGKSVPKNPKRKTLAAQHKQTVNVNSGFIISYDISYAIAAIGKHPVGPLRKAK